MKSWPLFLILALLLGAGSWFVLSSTPETLDEGSSGDSTLLEDSDLNEGSNESSSPDASDNISSAVDRMELENRPTEASLLPGTVAELPFEGPAATIKLRVVDGNGLPVDDSTAKFALNRWSDEVGDLDFDEWEKVNTLGVDSQGELAASVPVGTTFYLEVGGPFWRPQTHTVQPLQVDEVVDLGEISLTPANRVAGVVKGEGGELISDAHVAISETNGSMWGGEFRETDTTDDEGKFSFDGIRSGRFQFQVDAQGYAKTILRAEHIQQRQGEFQLEIIMPRGKSTRGRVVDEDGNGIAGAEVFTLVTDANFSFWGNDWDPPIPDDIPPATVTDANGDFVVYGLDEENVPKLGARAEGYGDGYASEVKIAGNSIIKLPRHFIVSGSVIAGQAGVSNAAISLQRFREDGELDWGGHTESDEDGKFEFDPIAPGSYTLTLSSALGAIDEQTIEVTEDMNDLRLTLSLDDLMTIRIVDGEGQPIAGADVSLAPGEQGAGGISHLGHSNISFEFSGELMINDMVGPYGGSSHATETDIDGVAKFASVPASRYTLKVEADGYASHSEALEVTGATQNHDVEMSAGGNLRVRVVDTTGQAVVGIQVALRTADAEQEMRTMSTDAAGRAIWSDLEAGDYQVSYSATDANNWWWNRDDNPDTPIDHSTVKVKAGELTDFELSVSDLALVTVHVTRHGANAEDVKVSISEIVDGPRNYWVDNGDGGTPTDGRGEVELQPVASGEYEISVKAGKSSPATKVKMQLHVGPQRVEIEIDGGAVVGQLQGNSGALANATVALAPVSMDEGDDRRHTMSFISYGNNGGYAMSSSDEQSTNTRSDRYGNFEFSDIPDGQWQVIARAKGYGTWKSPPFTVQGGNSIDLGSQQLYPGAVIHGHDNNFVAGDSEGNRWRYGPEIRLMDENRLTIAMASVDENGDYEIDDLPSGTFYISKRIFVSEELEVTVGGTYRVDIPLKEPEGSDEGN